MHFYYEYSINLWDSSYKMQNLFDKNIRYISNTVLLSKSK